jgi:hypothetical protein
MWREHFVNLGEDRSLILKWIIQKEVVRMWAELNFQDSVARFSEHWNEPLGAVKAWNLLTSRIAINSTKQILHHCFGVVSWGFTKAVNVFCFRRHGPNSNRPDWAGSWNRYSASRRTALAPGAYEYSSCFLAFRLPSVLGSNIRTPGLLSRMVHVYIVHTLTLIPFELCNLCMTGCRELSIHPSKSNHI